MSIGEPLAQVKADVFLMKMFHFPNNLSFFTESCGCRRHKKMESYVGASRSNQGKPSCSLTRIKEENPFQGGVEVNEDRYALNSVGSTSVCLPLLPVHYALSDPPGFCTLTGGDHCLEHFTSLRLILL